MAIVIAKGWQVKKVRGMIISSILPHSVDVMFDLIEGAKK